MFLSSSAVASLGSMAAVGGLVVVVSLWAVDHSAQVKEQALKDRDTVAEQNLALKARNDDLSAALLDQASISIALGVIGAELNKTQSVLTGQTAQLNRSLVEMKRSNEQIAAYLASPVPVALGLRYARTETTDPVEYRAAASRVRVDPVSSAGASSSDR